MEGATGGKGAAVDPGGTVSQSDISTTRRDRLAVPLRRGNIVWENAQALESLADPETLCAAVTRSAVSIQDRIHKNFFESVDGRAVVYLCDLHSIVEHTAEWQELSQKFRSFAAQHGDLAELAKLDDAELAEAAAGMHSVWRWGAKLEESRHALGSAKIGRHSHRRTGHGLSSEVLISEEEAASHIVDKEDSSKAAEELEAVAGAAQAKKQPQKASARSLYIGSENRARGFEHADLDPESILWNSSSAARAREELSDISTTRRDRLAVAAQQYATPYLTVAAQL